MDIYGALAARWYHLLDPVADHEEEAACYEAALVRASSPPARTLLELGAGAGNNAFYMKRRFRCTLADLSPEMSALSRAQNPDCEHVRGDMRALRLGATFDTVFVHDAVNYITTESDVENLWISCANPQVRLWIPPLVSRASPVHRRWKTRGHACTTCG